MPAAAATPDTRSPRGLALALVVTVFVLDQATKLWFLHGYDLRIHQPLVLAPFAELVVVWNRGISYGLFQQETELGRWILVVGSIVASLALGVWMLRTNVRVLALSLALIVGGALGNAVDRTIYGAVFDFVHLHWGRFSWYVFNVADAAIVAGVAGLLYDSLVLEPRRARKRTPSQESRDDG
jgi:signal peptidase II